MVTTWLLIELFGEKRSLPVTGSAERCRCAEAALRSFCTGRVRDSRR